MDRLLARQLKKCFGRTDGFSPEMERFIALADEAYRQEEGYRSLIQRSLELSSRELLDRARDLEATNALLESEIASHKLTLSALRLSEQAFADFFENASVGLKQIGHDAIVLHANRAEFELIGYPREEYIGHSLKEFYVEPEAAEELMRRILAGEVVRDAEARLRCKDGTIKHVLIDSNSLWANGVFVHARCFTRDNTARKQAEERVREQAALLDKAQDAIFVHKLDDSLVYWNASAERLYGWTQQSVVGKPIHEVLYRDAARYREAKQSALLSGDWVGELSHFAKDGREILVESRWTLVRDACEAPDSFLVINTDVTGKKLLEAKFLRTQRMESIGTLAAGMAHDLNNILQPICMSIHFFRSRLTDPDSREMLQVIGANAGRASNLVRQVLSFARGVDGEYAPIEPAHLIGEISDIVRATFPKTIDFEAEIAEKIWRLQGDFTQLHQVLLNLCLNARDAMPEGGRLRINVENVELAAEAIAPHSDARPGRHVMIAVTDSGTGIPLALREKIFDPFFTTKASGEGTGLGLSTSLGIIKSHDGFVDLTSTEGQGSSFRIFLPVALTPRPEPKPETPDAPNPRGRGELVMLVDDEVNIGKVLSNILERSGYRVILCQSGAEAVRAYQRSERKVQALVTDIVMPIMDGPALIQALHLVDPAMPVIGVTGIASEAMIASLRSLGVRHILQKPFTAHALLVALRELLRPEGGGALANGAG